MRQIERVVAAALAGVVVSGAAAQDAVQWRVEDGGNGHWYGIIVSEAVGDMFCWNEARDDASEYGGHLGTLTSQDESDFVCASTQIPVAPDGGSTRVWIGAFQDETTAEPAEFRWVTGEPWKWTNWGGGNPSNDGGLEDFVHFDHAPNPTWNDQYNCWTGHPNYAYLIEWSADCNSDGIVDYGQILDGSLPDDDQNGVPDCCDFSLPCGVAIEGHDWQIEPIEWKEEDGGNGHWYGRMCFNSGCKSSDGFYGFWVRDAYVLSKGGHLATMNSAEEQDFLRSNTLGGSFGGFQDRTAADYSEPNGGWRWVTGEPFDYTGWLPGEPNNSGGDEHYVFTCCGGEAGNWNDGATLATESVVEFSADCNGDGIVDYGQILDGTFEDIDGNGVPDVCEVCLGDITGNGVVDAADLGILLAVWNTNGKSNP
ncbi:hypothetical protein OAG48_00705, partial [bacterium]|nr:hypothetical protein [bacterium]